MTKIAEVAARLRERFETLADKRDILKASELKQLYAVIPSLPIEERRTFGQEINKLKDELEALVLGYEAALEADAITPIDVTAPFDKNVAPELRPKLLSAAQGTRHPLMIELGIILDIFYRMGFTAVESRQIDNDFNMFEALNFPEGHPARDDYDTFMTAEQDKN